MNVIRDLMLWILNISEWFKLIQLNHEIREFMIE